MNSTNKFQKKTVEYTTEEDRSRKYRMTVNYGMNYIRGNSQPYFSMTADVYEIRRNGKLREKSFGCQHALIVEHFPSLAPLVQWHLADQTGLPMHYVANAMYWVDCLLGKYERRSYDPDPVKTFASHVCLGRLDGDLDPADHETIALVMNGSAFVEDDDEVCSTQEEIDQHEAQLKARRRAATRAWVVARGDELQAAFVADMKAFGVEFIEVETETVGANQ